MQPITRRALLGRGVLSVTGLGLASVTLHGSGTSAMPAAPAATAGRAAPTAHDVRRYGAVGDGVTDDTAPVRRAFADAHADGGDVLVPPGRYRVSEPVPVDQPIAVRGSGDTSVLVAGAVMPEVLRVTVPQYGLFTDLRFDGNGLALRCVTQTVPREDSVATRWVRCKFTGATETQVVNDGCEDVTYLDCATDGDESRPLSIPDALSVHVPNGAVRIIGGEWFGRCTFNAQQVALTDATIGPLFIDNPDGRPDSILSAQGCYLYDGGRQGDACIDTDTNLSNLHLAGCYFAPSVHDSYLNGHLPSVSVRVQDCVFTHPTGAADDHVSWVLTASGSGQLVIDGGRAAPRPAGAVHALRSVGDCDIALSTPVPCLGLT